ncbi:DUF2635 domain-containing protein [Phenylobacterium sp.]|uniref:DUF2635 domain-containing protein n=1 Tax=Phenylobacterium sp. TaxID=1871053 RepID=UPI0035B081F3
MLVKPAPGLLVRDPRTLQLIPAEGVEVSPTDLYWSRALRDGDVVEVRGMKAVKAAPPAQPAS